jgi:hypothetical protein
MNKLKQSPCLAPAQRVLILACLVVCSVCSFPGSARAQSQPAAQPFPDPIQRLNERLDALERENAAVRAENARLERLITARANLFTPVQATATAPLQPPTPESATISPGVDGAMKDIAERLGTRYDNGFVVVDSPDPDRIPFKMVVRNFAQVRFTNTQLDSLTYVDHLGNVLPVNPRNDFSFNRDLLAFTGYAFDPKLQYNVIVWGSGSLASVVMAGGFTYEFCKAFALSGGYNALPGSMSLLGGYRDLPGIDRSMADTFFRPGFTQGVWASGQPVDNLFYNIMVGNSLNTLNIGTKKIDTNMAYSGAVWWEPLGSYGPVFAYNDLEKHSSPVIRVGTNLTRSREDRFSDETVTSPDNIQIYNSDGVLFFSTGALAPGVTIDLADYTMWAINAGFKYQGLSINGQYFFRWLNNFRADGPLPISSEFDHGFEASVGHFFFPKLEFYGRTSFIFGEFRDSHEVCGGFNWYPLENRGLRVVGEVGRVEGSPVGNIITPYQAGMTGWMFLLQAQLNF